MTQALHQSWHVGKASGACSACNATLDPGIVCWAALCERKHIANAVAVEVPPAEEKKKSKDKSKEPEIVSPYERVDFCETCWAAGKRPGHDSIREDLEMFSFWRTTIPQPQAKKKLLVDDSVLVDLFSRMSERADPAEERFRFVLALILMHKRLLKYESTTHAGEPPNQKEIWNMLLRGNASQDIPPTPMLVTNPHLTADQISDVSQQLSSVLAEEI